MLSVVVEMFTCTAVSAPSVARRADRSDTNGRGRSRPATWSSRPARPSRRTPPAAHCPPVDGSNGQAPRWRPGHHPAGGRSVGSGRRAPHTRRRRPRARLGQQRRQARIVVAGHRVRPVANKPPLALPLPRVHRLVGPAQNASAVNPPSAETSTPTAGTPPLRPTPSVPKRLGAGGLAAGGAASPSPGLAARTTAPVPRTRPCPHDRTPAHCGPRHPDAATAQLGAARLATVPGQYLDPAPPSDSRPVAVVRSPAVAGLVGSPSSMAPPMLALTTTGRPSRS